ncbi:uncharacterized protein LTR77_002004 [Saxophila tyrrhenica]|uniref:NACHT domain-containing protein n=1 Tax=Saxophila tyrrhenica TaxID=1690608 RepID=A0AAV9PKV5_9PEZI|nr:hypothetical protein LTR77_002004 [Saxophila tyrrhenica]
MGWAEGAGGRQALFLECWNGDAEVSQGLLQSLLFRILSTCPENIPSVCAARWAQHTDEDQEAAGWTRRELSEAFTAVLQRSLDTRFLFFIDGLDEYVGGFDDLLADLRALTDSPLAKICVSSRPWNPFKEASGSRPELMLVLQDLTSTDIYRYVQASLQSNPRFVALAAREPRAHNLPKEIRDKAQGVFLWVYLVVRSLLRELGERDNFAMLEKRLRDTPADLKELFVRIPGAVEPVYREWSARALLIATGSGEALPLVFYWFLQEDAASPELAFKRDTNVLPDSEVPAVEDESMLRINSWTRDFLECTTLGVQGQAGDTDPPILRSMNVRKVDFLHRTVRDFLLEPERTEILFERAGVGFDPFVVTCRVFLILAKDLRHHDEVSAVARLRDLILIHLERTTTINTRKRILAELSVLGRTLPGANRERWSRLLNEMDEQGAARSRKLDDAGMSRMLTRTGEEMDGDEFFEMSQRFYQGRLAQGTLSRRANPQRAQFRTDDSALAMGVTPTYAKSMSARFRALLRLDREKKG